MAENKTLMVYESFDLHPLINQEWLREREKSALPSLVRKDEFSRITRFLFWLDDNKLLWTDIGLSKYRDYLLEQGLAPSSVSTILSTIRQSYRRALTDNDVLQEFRHVARTELTSQDKIFSLADVKALTDTLIETIENNINPLNSAIAEVNVADRADTEHTWLTQQQVETLLGMPQINTLKGLRDLIVLSLMVGMGLRESEVCNLRVRDIIHKFGGEPALKVAVGKGRKTRLIPYGAQDWIIPLISNWLLMSDILNESEEVFVIRGMHSSSGGIRQNKLSTRSVQRIVDKYRPDGIRITPHDLRRTYARLMYMSGIDIERISQNMGHNSFETTRDYVGTLSVEDRSPGKLFDNPNRISEVHYD